MSEPFLSEIKIVGFTFAPRGWAQCDGQILPINQNQSLYSLLGTTYGGDGRTSFALPDLRGRTPIHPGDNGVNLGSKGGEHQHVLTEAETPAHTHSGFAKASAAPGDTGTPAANKVISRPLGALPFSNNETSLVELGPSFVSTEGGQAHENMQPYIALNFCIALQGVFPSRN
jgi:microcystin-dependent protein